MSIGIHMCGKRGLVTITNYCTRTKLSNLMTFAKFGVDIPKEIDSVGDTRLGFPLYLMAGPYNCSTDVLL